MLDHFAAGMPLCELVVRADSVRSDIGRFDEKWPFEDPVSGMTESTTATTGFSPANLRILEYTSVSDGYNIVHRRDELQYITAIVAGCPNLRSWNSKPVVPLRFHAPRALHDDGQLQPQLPTVDPPKLEHKAYFPLSLDIVTNWARKGAIQNVQTLKVTHPAYLQALAGHAPQLKSLTISSPNKALLNTTLDLTPSAVPSTFIRRHQTTLHDIQIHANQHNTCPSNDASISSPALTALAAACPSLTHPSLDTRTLLIEEGGLVTSSAPLSFLHADQLQALGSLTSLESLALRPTSPTPGSPHPVLYQQKRAAQTLLQDLRSCARAQRTAGTSSSSLSSLQRLSLMCPPEGFPPDDVSTEPDEIRPLLHDVTTADIDDDGDDGNNGGDSEDGSGGRRWRGFRRNGGDADYCL
ncbi:hypothetical protein LTS18_005300 [Coniosporium uncinatum]|uniref:Uncharacterized protein n=1 Tax=Coniosporium uncinatum TaxID=93489 RepID=A0ACC3DAZ3_9PEZI|nr:hypothetical protein LTS18_005300 [Coniosporium uncinatum]